MKKELDKVLVKKPIIAALCREEELEDLCLSNVAVAFVLCGDMKTLPEIVQRLKKASIIALVYIDFIEGLSARSGAVDFVKYYTHADGIVSTKSSQIKRANELDMITVQRYFVFDRISRSNIKKQIAVSAADAVEVLPGVIPGVIKYLSEDCKIGLIAGGFVDTQKDVKTALENGACGITTSVANIWFLANVKFYLDS